MKPQDENRKLREYIRQSKQRRRWHGLTAVLATAAAVLTLCVMVLPAVTLENTPQALACQLDDLHTHTDSCYDEEGELVCGYADFVAHTHDSSCYGEDGTLICPLEERKPHTHTESCYQETETLVCGREETQGHTHTEACYETQLVCSQEESQGHTHTGHVHTDACYTVARTPICESTEPDHVHTEECSEAHQELTCTQDTGCYDENGNLACSQEETQGHTHSEECYDTQLVCGQEETEPHTHIDSCYQVQRELVCGQEEVILHTHTEGCWDEDGNLTCGMVEIKEHVHDETCLPEEEVASHTLAAQNEAVGTDFGPYITSTQVQVKSGDQWVDIEGGTVTDGSSIQVTIYYHITDSHIVTADNNIIYYQLPNGIRLTEEENGPVEVGDKIAGTYTITTDGLITITFSEDFADGDPFAGNISFYGEVSLADIEEGDDIVFGGAGGTITIVPDAGDTSLHIEKTGEYKQAEGKIHYTVTVSSKDGSDGSITFEDKFLDSSGCIAYNIESVHVVDSDGNPVDVEPNLHVGSAWFDMILPELGQDGSYTITYTATVHPDMTSKPDGSVVARNQAKATDKSNSVQTIHNLDISGPRIEKTGVYNPSTREVVWTVYLYNPRGYDLAGKTLRDTMTWTYGEKTLEQVITSATLTPYIGETPGEPETIELPYEFPANSTKSYILTYTTSLPEDAAVGADLSVTNTAWLDNWKAVYAIDGTVPGKTGLVKTFTGQGEGDAVESDLNWSSIVTFPQGTLEAGTLDSVRYVDIIQDAVNEGGQLRAGTHYTTPELLQQLVAAPVDGYNQLEALEYGTDYTIQVVTAADFQKALGETYYNATGVGYVFETVAFDQLFNGFTFDGKTYQFHWQDLEEVDGGTPIAMFAVTFTQSALDKLNAVGQISISYSTHYDLSKVTGNGTYTLVNGGRTPSNSAAANTETALLAQLNKQVSTIGSHDYTLESDAYTDGPAAMDVGDTDGNIYYRILLYNFGDEISLQDTMWATQYGWSVGFDSIKVYDAATGDVLETLTIWGENGHLGSNPYWGTYTLKNLAAYRGCIIGLYYHVDVSANLPQGETQTITNTVEWTGVAKDSVGTTVTNSKPTLEKESALADGENNLVYYYVTINPGAKDLHPESNQLQLEDTLTLPNGVSATLLPNTIKLYTYDSANGSNHYLGDDITDATDVFAVVATEGKENSYTFTVPDGTACVVVYAYEIDRGTYAGDNIEVNNAAMLMGSAVISAGDEIQLDNQGSSSQANKATLTIYKIGGNDVSNLLQGVLFDLFRYEEQEGGGYEWVRTDVTAEGPPAGDGGNHFITGGDNVEGAIILNFLDEGGGNGNGSHYNTLYRLTEFETLPGYKLDTTPRYYVWGRNGATEESTQAAMADVLKKAGVTWDEVTFIPYGGSETQTIANEPTTTEITVTKTWQGAEGTPLEEGLPDSVEVTLYVEIPSIDVSLPIYHGTSEEVLQVAVGHIEGSSLPVGGESTHCVISGHRGLPSARLFTDLDQLAEGDIFTLRVLDETLTYEVDQIHVVEPDDITQLEIVEGEDLCTLVTCTPYGVNSHRLLVRGHRVENREDGVMRIIADAMQIDPRFVAPVIGAPILLAALLVMILRPLRRRKRKR